MSVKTQALQVIYIQCVTHSFAMYRKQRELWVRFVRDIDAFGARKGERCGDRKSG
jgi:hypothetical protein